MRELMQVAKQAGLLPSHQRQFTTTISRSTLLAESNPTNFEVSWSRGLACLLSAGSLSLAVIQSIQVKPPGNEAFHSATPSELAFSRVAGDHSAIDVEPHAWGVETPPRRPTTKRVKEVTAESAPTALGKV